MWGARRLCVAHLRIYDGGRGSAGIGNKTVAVTTKGTAMASSAEGFAGSKNAKAPAVRPGLFGVTWSRHLFSASLPILCRRIAIFVRASKHFSNLQAHPHITLIRHLLGKRQNSAGLEPLASDVMILELPVEMDLASPVTLKYRNHHQLIWSTHLHPDQPCT